LGILWGTAPRTFWILGPGEHILNLKATVFDFGPIVPPNFWILGPGALRPDWSKWFFSCVCVCIHAHARTHIPFNKIFNPAVLNSSSAQLHLTQKLCFNTITFSVYVHIETKFAYRLYIVFIVIKKSIIFFKLCPQAFIFRDTRHPQLAHWTKIMEMFESLSYTRRWKVPLSVSMKTVVALRNSL
jgi:hypothetical protein